MFAYFVLSMATAPRSDEGDLLDMILKIGAGLVFVGIPLIKSILQAREKAKTESQSDDRRTARERELEGRRAFEDLMRGRTTLAPPPIPSAPPPTMAPPAEAQSRSGQRTTTLKPLTDLQEIPATPLTGPEFEAEEGAPDEEIIARVERREREELQRQQAELLVPEELAREEYAASSSLRESVEPVPVEVFRSPAVGVAGSPATANLAGRLLGTGTDRRSALRRALVMNEVLGRPVAARDGSESSTPVGLRG